MKNNEKGFSLIVVVIFMSLAALFVGYLMGNWLISILIDDSEEQIAQQEQSPSVSQNVEQKESEEDNFNNTQNNLTAPPEDSSEAVQSDAGNSSAADQSQTANQTEPQENTESDSSAESPSPAEITGGYGVQIGAFSNYNNAKALKDKVEDLGYEAVITDTSPHQVQVTGYETREEAESAEEKLEAEGYNGFIVARE